MRAVFKHERLKQARNQCRMSTPEVVKVFKLMYNREITHPTILNHEKKRCFPDAETLAIYALVYGKPVSYFFDKKVNRTG